MDVKELLELESPLTPEEFDFIERELVARTREFAGCISNILKDVAAEDPRLARQLERASKSMLENVEKGAAAPGPDGRPGVLARH